MGTDFVVHQLQRQKDQKQLVKVKELHMKEKDRQKFEIPEEFNELMIDEGYIIQR